MKGDSIKTRIETKTYIKDIFNGYLYERRFHQNKDWNGLITTIPNVLDLCMKGDSIKTRIETPEIVRIGSRLAGMKGDSIKTRIETL